MGCRPAEGSAAVSGIHSTTELHDDQTGCWQVTTRTSIYVLDLDARTVFRVPGVSYEHGLSRTRLPVYVTRPHPGDRRPEPLLRLKHCVVGDPMRLRRLRDEGDLTSTPVIHIVRLNSAGT